MIGINIEKLKARIKVFGWNLEKFATHIGITRTTFYRKIKNGGEGFLIWEINEMIKALRLTKEEATEIFFENVEL